MAKKKPVPETSTVTVKLFKVVRQDMTACYNSNFKYELGVTATDPKYDGKPECGNGLHASYTPMQAMGNRNGVWPVRLLSVELGSKSVKIDESKCKSDQLTPIEELPISLAFGPCGDAVIVKLQQIAEIQWLKPKQENRVKVAAIVREHLKRLRRFGGPDSAAVVFTNDLDAAWAAAWAAARDAARAAAWAAARDAAMAAAWDAAWDAARAAARAAARDAAWAAAWAAARDAAMAAARDAAMAAEYSTVADLLDWPSPWEPLLEIYELGYWPICLQKDGKFLVYEPKIG